MELDAETTSLLREVGPVSWERMSNAVEKVRERLLRATKALNAHEVPYAVIGGNAVAAWVSRVDESVVRNTRDVDLLIRREDLDAAKEALATAGFILRTVRMLGKAGSIEMFFDGPRAKARDAVHIIFAREKVSTDSLEPAPGVEESEDVGEFRLLQLEALLRMKLTSFRDKDRVHVRDLISTGQIDASWLPRLPESLRGRLRELLDDPDG